MLSRSSIKDCYSVRELMSHQRPAYICIPSTRVPTDRRYLIILSRTLRSKLFESVEILATKLARVSLERYFFIYRPLGCGLDQILICQDSTRCYPNTGVVAQIH